MNQKMTINDLLGTEDAVGMEMSDAELAMVFGGSGFNPAAAVGRWLASTVGSWIVGETLNEAAEAESRRQANVLRDSNGIPHTPNWTNEPHGA